MSIKLDSITFSDFFIGLVLSTGERFFSSSIVDALKVGEVFPAAIIFWSSSIPSIKASGVGGQPGTYTSTGITQSTPGTTL